MKNCRTKKLIEITVHFESLTLRDRQNSYRTSNVPISYVCITIKPVKGKIVTNYAIDSLIWNMRLQLNTVTAAIDLWLLNTKVAFTLPYLYFPDSNNNMQQPKLLVKRNNNLSLEK